MTAIVQWEKWENSNIPHVINQARAQIARCVSSRKIELGELAYELQMMALEASAN